MSVSPSDSAWSAGDSRAAGEDLGVLVDRAVEDDGLRAVLVEIEVEPELVGQEVELALEGPGAHVGVEVVEVGVVAVRLVDRAEAVLLRQELDERRLPGPDVSCDGDEPRHEGRTFADSSAIGKV